MPLVLVYLQRSLCPSLLQQFPQAVCLIDQKRVGGIMLCGSTYQVARRHTLLFWSGKYHRQHQS